VRAGILLLLFLQDSSFPCRRKQDLAERYDDYDDGDGR
jgi:hypothetical protein